MKYLINTFIECLSYCKHGRFRPGLKYFQLFFIVLRDIVIEGQNVFSKSRVKCPICGWKGQRFFHFYSGCGEIRNNAICPKCGALERQRAMAEFLAENLPKDKEIDLLYVAPHSAVLNMISHHQNVSVTTIDLHSPVAEIKMDLHHLSFPDESFDLVICSHVLEHVRNDIQCMKELYRILKKGGLALLPVPIYSFEETIEYEEPDTEQHGHVREYGKDYFHRLQSVWFQPIPEWEAVMAVRRSL